MASPLGQVLRDGTTNEFLDGLARREFLLRSCTNCGHIGGPQEPTCDRCGSGAADRVVAGGLARLVSWSVVYQRDIEGDNTVNAIVAIGELDEGPWWWSQVFDADPTQMYTGRRMVLDYEPAQGGETLAVFRLV